MTRHREVPKLRGGDIGEVVRVGSSRKVTPEVGNESLEGRFMGTAAQPRGERRMGRGLAGESGETSSHCSLWLEG